jgi:hypothetical protein
MTKITAQHQATFDFIREAPEEQLVLFSCFRDGIPTAVICRVTESRFETFNVYPLFVAVDNEMTLKITTTKHLIYP